jgi:uncharacterized protein
MQLCKFDTIQAFWHNAQDYLLQHEAEHNLLLGISHTLLHYPDRYPDPPYLAIASSCRAVTHQESAQTKGKIQAVAMRTPPYKLLLSKALDFNALALIAKDLQNDPEQLPGVSGLVAEVETFLQAWQTLTGQSFRQVMEMRTHRLTQVESVATASGSLRLATESDRPLLIEWHTAFASEVGELMSLDAEKAVNTGLKQQAIYLWEDGIPVSWATAKQFLPTAARIGPVYTPPEHRCKGYATACVAALSQRLLDRGCDRCFLFTDLANPISNRIYAAIGYRPVCDWHDYSFILKEEA